MRYRSRIVVLALGAFLAAAGAIAADLRPAVPKAEGAACVEPTDVMRRDHMNLLKHQRDATVHDGVRTRQHSLNGCLACHAVAGADRKPVGYDSPQHFCRSCHDYAAVSIDCFSCHSARPDGATPARAEAAR